LNFQPVNSPLETGLLAALTQLAETAKAMPAAKPKPNLLPLLARVEELAKQLPRETDPTLLHYLHKQSYEKARLFLQGRDAENRVGHCRQV